MKRALIDTAFEIQGKIETYLKTRPGFEFVGCGQIVDPRLNGTETVLHRDYEWNEGDKEYWLTHSTIGELEGEYPSEVESTIKEILKPYTKKVPFKIVRNTDGDID